MATALAINPHYGNPSGSKQHRINAMWRTWAAGMAMLRSIKAEESVKLAASANAAVALDRVNKWNS